MKLSTSVSSSSLSAYQATQQWVEQWVIGLGLCPFAVTPWKNKTVHIHVFEESSVESLLHTLVEQAQSLIARKSEFSTTLVITPYMLKDFDDFLETVDLADLLFHELSLSADIQLATFHPNYLFDREPLNSRSHLTNRSPYPTFHLLLEDEVTQAVDRFGNTGQIPIRNIAKLEQLDPKELLALQQFYPDDS